MAMLYLNTGKHDRKICPVLMPVDARPSTAYSVRIGAQQVPGQGYVAADCHGVLFILDDAPSLSRFDLRVEEAPSVNGQGVSLDDRGSGVVSIRIADQIVTEYHYADGGNRPFLYPVIGPFGKRLTRNYPMVPDYPGENRDHPHHRSIWTAHGDVNGQNDWAEGPAEARIEHRRFLSLESGPVFGRLLEELDWVSPAGEKLLSEEREILVYNTPAENRYLDWRVTLKATNGKVCLGDTKEGGILSVRVAISMDAARDGVIENAWGGIGEAECWGKPAAWCDYSGPVEGQQVGIAVFDWPGNPRFPTTWHVRDYGLMTANIFGQRAFHGDSPSYNGNLNMPAGSALTFRYRIFLHPGRAADADVAGRYLDFIFPPKVEQ